MTTIQLRRGPSSEWTAVNPVLASGECGVETDTGKYKIGNGSATWQALDYFVSKSVVDQAIGIKMQEHITEPDPHSQYATDADLAAAVDAHITNPDPHPQYSTDEDLAGHIADPDPHPQYSTEPEVETKIQNHIGEMDPHPIYLNKLGGTMEGPLLLAGNPIDPLEAASKAYVDSVGGGSGGGGLDVTTADQLYVNVVGDKMTGSLEIEAPTAELTLDGDISGLNLFKAGIARWVIRQQDPDGDLVITAVDNIGIEVGQALRLRRIDGKLILLADPTDPLGIATKQYVDANSGGGFDQAQADALYVNVTGDTVQGNLTVIGDVVANYLHALYGADMGGARVTSVADPIDPTDVVNKQAMDAAIAAIPPPPPSGLTQEEADVRYVNADGGDILSGEYVIRSASGDVGSLVLDSAGATASIQIRQSGVTRWRFQTDYSDFVLQRHNASGAYIDKPFRIDVETGQMMLGVAPVDPTAATTKQYVDQIVTVDIVPPSAPPSRDGLLWVQVAV